MSNGSYPLHQLKQIFILKHKKKQEKTFSYFASVNIHVFDSWTNLQPMNEYDIEDKKIFK